MQALRWERWLVPLLPFLTLLLGSPHYGATLMRVFSTSGDRGSYARFGLQISLLAAAAFVAGAAAGSLIGHAAAHHRRSAVLLTVALLLALARLKEYIKNREDDVNTPPLQPAINETVKPIQPVSQPVIKKSPLPSAKK